MDKSEWETMMDQFRARFAQKIIRSVRMKGDGSLDVDSFLGRAFSFSHVTPDCSTYKVILAVLDELGCKLKPNEGWCQPYEPPPNPEEYITPDSLERMAFELNIFEKVEMLDDGSIVCWEKWKDRYVSYPFSAGAPHIAALEKHIGPLMPGKIFEFPRREEWPTTS